MGRAMQAERESASTGAGGKQAGSRIGPVEVSTLGRNGGYMRYRNWRRSCAGQGLVGAWRRRSSSNGESGR
jgi:hypothetical protein